ncbi:hypothetical protein GGI19_001663 [Coemansia pectinata]|uniref:Myb-like domain-containing protein n=1 Tax=Coemansia pectinata TaxID=1052879 RepID=A0A9W8LCL6_9FUNG|nr:hypothetical protein GGI19_001663 [Coemansia pectinata]
MPPQRTNRSFTTSKVSVPTSRHLPLLHLPPLGRSTTQLPAGPSAEIQKTIVDEARLLQQQDSSVPWYQPVSKYCLSIDAPQSIYNQTEIDAQQNQQSALVTRAAERHFDGALGQCDWEAVASKLDIPLIECLDLFNASNSTIKSRLVIESYGGWSNTDVERLKRFIAANYADDSIVDWRLVGAYMNVDPLECQRVGQGTFKGPINEMSRYEQYVVDLERGTAERLTAEWTDAERKLIENLIEQHLESTTRSELVDIIQRELPARPLSDIHLFTAQYVYELKAGRVRGSQMTQIRELVAETRLFQRLTDSGVKSKDAAQILGAESRQSCQDNMPDVESSALQQGDAALLRSHWTTADDVTLLKLIDGSRMNPAAKWEQASKALDHSVTACRQWFSVIKHSRKPVTDDRESIVTSEVQIRIKSSGVVAWSQVSQATGFDVRECLELSQYDVGKASWRYGPDLISQSRAKNMTSFIEEHFPAPTTVSYRAVSNYMWIDIEDCIRIHDVLQGKFKWTEAEYERATALRAQGLAWKEVAKHLSPTLSDQAVQIALKRHLTPAPEPISAEELQEISRLIDEYSGKYPVTEINNKIRTQLKLGNRSNYHSILSLRITAHQYYQAKLRDIDYNGLDNRIAMGHTTATIVAKELDVPRYTLDRRLKNRSSKKFSSKWSERETRQLIDYMQSGDSKPDIAYFSKLLGTKNSKQCSSKVSYLKQKGILI